MVIMYHCRPCVSAAGHEASEGDGAAREKPERTVGETGEVQWAGTALKKKRNLNITARIYTANIMFRRND